MSMPSSKELQTNAVRQAINEALPLLSDKGRALIHRIHDNAPWKGLANCPDAKLSETYELIRRSLP